ncbi:lipopolysaccharide biosynthesis protein [Rhodoblastus sp.]|uniref:lipopolysaccharide biosynthesis protein n=1 Tax=Rhodoblastus sp. TaxID=1962975 RepID=UPI003F9E5670
MSAEELSVNALSTEHLHADLRGRSVRGGLVNLTSQGAQFLIQSIATVVLARLLTPADFGLVAMVATITGLGQAFADLGLSEATIQRKEITHNQVSTLFWINVAIGLALMLLTAALAPVLATFYREPRLVKITLLVSLTFLIGGLRVQPDAILKRQMRFSSIAIRDVAGYCLAVPLAIAMAWRGAGYWALVALPLTLNLSALILSWLMVDWRPGLPRRDAQVSSMIAFGGNVAASYFLLTISRSADNVLVGWYWGAGPLGLYSKAYNLLMLPVRQLSVPAAGVAIPAFSRIQSDPERFARYYLRVAVKRLRGNHRIRSRVAAIGLDFPSHAKAGEGESRSDLKFESGSYIIAQPAQEPQPTLRSRRGVYRAAGCKLGAEALEVL